MSNECSEGPFPERLAAFDKRTVSKDEQAVTSDHLTSCELCSRLVMSDHLDRESDFRLPMSSPPRRRWWLGAAAAAAFVAAIALQPLLKSENGAIQALVEAVPHSRLIEPRLSGGFPWTPLRPVTRSTAQAVDPKEMLLIGVAGSVLEQTQNDESIEARHAAALAHLLAGRPEEAVELLKAIAPKANEARIWSDLAASLYAASIRRDSSSMLAEALAAADAALRLDDDFLEALFNRALIMERLGLEKEARAAWQRYLTIEDDRPWAQEARGHLQNLAPMSEDPQLSTKFHERAQNAALQGKWVTSLSLFGTELDLLFEKGDDPAAAEILLTRARIYKRIGNNSAAAQDLARAGDVIRRIQDVALRKHAEADHLAVQATLASAPAQIVRLLSRALDLHRSSTRCGYVPEMYLQRARAFTAENELAKAAAELDAGIRELELEREDKGWEIAIARQELFEEALTLALSRGDATRAFAYAERARTPHVAFSSQAILSAASDDVIIAYAALPGRLVIFAIRDGRIDAVQSKIGREALAGEIARLTSSAEQRNDSQFRQMAAVLYSHLLAPVAIHLGESQSIVFVPDTTLSSVPFSALIGPTGRYVIEDHPVVMVPSAMTYAQLAAVRRPATAGRNLLLITGPSLGNADLPSVKREADAIAAIYGSRATRRQKGIDGSNFAKYAAGADIIHFAGHGLVPENGVDAALVTSGGGDTNGLLTAPDIAAMHLLRTRLVVLSACNTGRVGENGGAQNLSVARAFLIAGVPSVVATLWPIDDRASAEFFVRLHEHLSNGATPAVALRTTQIEWLRRPNPGAHLPAIWAAVQVVGV